MPYSTLILRTLLNILRICPTCSQDTALRDIQDLMRKGVMVKSNSGGRSTNYELLTVSN